MTSIARALPAALLALSSHSAAATGEAPALLLRAGTVWTGKGGPLVPGAVLVEGGRIRDVAASIEEPEGAAVLDWPEGVVTPGLIDAHSHLGLRADLVEPTEAFTPDARAIDVLDPLHPELERACRAGTTTILLAPGDANVAGGTAAVVRTGGPSGGRILVAEAALKLSIAPPALRGDREPTSRAGALAGLRARVAEAAADGAGHAFARLARGEIPAFVDARANDEVLAALRFGRGFDLRLVLVHASRCSEIADDLAGIAVVAGPFGLGTPLRELRGPAALVAKGIPLAFGTSSMSAEPAALRGTATLAVRAGLAPEAALRSLTSAAAAILGVGDRAGTLERGKDADLVVWSGSPLDPSTRPLAVFVLGERQVDERERAARVRRPGDPAPEEPSR